MDSFKFYFVVALGHTLGCLNFWKKSFFFDIYDNFLFSLKWDPIYVITFDLSELESQCQGHSVFKGLYLVKELSWATICYSKTPTGNHI